MEQLFCTTVTGVPYIIIMIRVLVVVVVSLRVGRIQCRKTIFILNRTFQNSEKLHIGALNFVSQISNRRYLNQLDYGYYLIFVTSW